MPKSLFLITLGGIITSSPLLETEEGCQKIKEFVEGEVSDRLQEKVRQLAEVSSLPEFNRWAREYTTIELLGYGLIS
ncbi:31986_t:CDS:2, partial [Racocetra persica]